VQKKSGDSADYVEDQISEMTKLVFHIIPKYPQEPHIPDDMEPALMHEHRSENGERQRHETFGTSIHEMNEFIRIEFMD